MKKMKVFFTVLAASLAFVSSASAQNGDFNNGGNRGDFNNGDRWKGDRDRDNEDVIVRKLRGGDFATVVTPNRRGEFIRYEFTCDSSGDGVKNYLCTSYSIDAWTKAFKLTQKISFSNGTSTDVVLADNLGQDACLKRADEFYRRDREQR